MGLFTRVLRDFRIHPKRNVLMAETEIQKTNSRKLAVQIISEWQETGTFPDRLMEADIQDRPFVMELVYGIARWRRMLEWVVGLCTKRKPDKHTMPYLLVGLYQILLMDNVAEYAAVNETVEAVKTGRVPSRAGFINAVLRYALREADNIKEDLRKQEPGIRESHPDMLTERWRGRFGYDRMMDLCRWNNRRGEITVRINTALIDMDDFLDIVALEGIRAVPHCFRPDLFIVLPGGIRVTELPGYSDGIFSVQDPSTQAAVDLLAPGPGDTVLDACAAPGGKTFIIADKMGGTGRLIAMDVDKNRINRLNENVKRWKLNSVDVFCADASVRRDLLKICGDVRFDRIILDVPCSNTGVLRRRPDARWRFHKENLEHLNSCQYAILDSASELLKHDGTLVYSTCSIEPEENSELIDSWLKNNPGFTLEKKVELFPPETQTDGIYACAIVRC